MQRHRDMQIGARWLRSDVGPHRSGNDLAVDADIAVAHEVLRQLRDAADDVEDALAWRALVDIAWPAEVERGTVGDGNVAGVKPHDALGPGGGRTAGGGNKWWDASSAP